MRLIRHQIPYRLVWQDRKNSHFLAGRSVSRLLELGQLHCYKKAIAKVQDLKTASLKFADSSSDGAMKRVGFNYHTWLWKPTRNPVECSERCIRLQ